MGPAGEVAVALDILAILPERSAIKVIDIGAMSLGPGTDSYAALERAGVAEIVGFEPVRAECDKLNAAASESKVYLPYAVGDGAKRVLHICNFPMTSSLYEPNTDLVEKFQNLANVMEVVEKQEVETRRLDDIQEVADPDYLKLDVQGAELDVLNGAATSLAQAVVVHTEVEFVPLYKGQPLFGDVDQRLREAGFQFHKFGGISGRTFKPLVANKNINEALSQQLWADAVYVKDFMALDLLSVSKLLKLATILHLVYRSWDFVAFVLRAYDARVNTNLADAYVQQLINRPTST
jgi:FkbM family methyltransferase